MYEISLVPYPRKMEIQVAHDFTAYNLDTPATTTKYLFSIIFGLNFWGINLV